MKSILFLLSLVMVLMGSGVMAQSSGHRPSFVSYTELGGLFGRVASGPSIAQTVSNRLSFTAQTLNGAQLTRRLAVGGLVGIDWYKAALLMPVGAGVRFDLVRHPERNVRLLAVADGGYGFAWLHRGSTGYVVRGGWMLNPGISLRVGKPSASAFVLALTYKRQEADVQKPIVGNDIRRDEHRVYNRLCIRAGVAF